MRAVVYHGPGNKEWEEVPKPTIVEDGDAIVRVDAVTICGTDLHILKGDVPAVVDGRVLGHEAVGTIEEVGSGRKNHQAGRPGSRLLHHVPAADAGSAVRVVTGSVWLEADGYSVTRSTARKRSTCVFHSPTPPRI